MSIGQRRGADRVETASGTAHLLPGPPLIAPARAYTFPYLVAGEEDALARGALWIDVRPKDHGSFLAQCALGFATGGVAHGLWPLATGVLAVAGGYAYALNLEEPMRTTLLPMRPVVQVLALPASDTAILVGYHAVFVVDGSGHWQSPRLSWEGVSLTACDGELLHGTGWDLVTDEDVLFTLDLRNRTLQGGGYRTGGSSASASV